MKWEVKWSSPQAADYPILWKHLSQPPLIFSYRGRPVWNEMPTLSVVGSRTPMRDSQNWMQRELGEYLRTTEVAIVSGGARGVDQWAHRLALDHRRPTVCVFPSGLLNPYPPGVETLCQEILAGGGALVSTFDLHQGMSKALFHKRNRWIAGFSLAMLVVEANRRSGSALSARLAREEQREVATLPVSPLSLQGMGNLELLNDGATLIRDAKDISVMMGRLYNTWTTGEPHRGHP